MKTYRIHITGLVQGVGFRPHVYRIAEKFSVTGEVENSNEGVFIMVNATPDVLKNFISGVKSDAPLASRIESISTEEVQPVDFIHFRIKKSEDISDDVTDVSPDIAVCDDCLEDMKRQEHRKGYPFINCTNCGPRFTIIKDLPYDREMTTMDKFVMCDRCRKEYEDVGDRRFHAQPVACNHCGPVYSVAGTGEVTDQDTVIMMVAGAIEEGKIIAIKGMGGYHLVCDASNEKAVSELRRRKQRDGKPFAIMCRSVEEARVNGIVSDTEEAHLESWQRPVVILKSRNILPYPVSNGLDTIGIILPYMPFHFLLFDILKCGAVVFTSANLSDEPVITGNDEAVNKLSGIADMIVTYNRDIHNRADDSVVRVMNNSMVIIRRSRGFTPTPVRSAFNTEGIFAAGAELVNAFAIGKGRNVILSQYIGDLKNQPANDFYGESYRLMKRLFRFSPSLIVHDLHPDYLSTSFARELAGETGARVVGVQHHFAHIVSCMAENMIEGKVIGLSLDGVGLGTDGNIWGGEVMVAGYTGFERRFHFDLVPIMGADRVSSDPWRSELAYLYRYGLLEKAMGLGLFKNRLTESEISLYTTGIEKKINTHLYSSAGRLFDAVSSLSGVVHKSSFHAEAPMRLEAIATYGETGSYDYEISGDVISFAPAFSAILDDIGRESAGIISARFHNTVGNALASVADIISAAENINKVVLTGGTFQNNWLVAMLYKRLADSGKEVYCHGVVPPNDNGIAAGQLVAAAALRESGMV